MAKRRLHKEKSSKPRGNPSKILPYRWKPGFAPNPRGSSAKARLSEAIVDELAQRADKDSEVTRAGIIASNLLSRAEHDSSELDRVLRITEPALGGKISGTGLSIQTDDMTVVYNKLFRE